MKNTEKAPIHLQNIVIRLIKDDLVNTRFIDRLNKAGLDASPFLLHLHEAIFLLMELGDRTDQEEMYEWYFQQLEKADLPDHNIQDESVHELAHGIFRTLQEMSLKKSLAEIE